MHDERNGSIARQIAAVVLAGGASARMGQDKALLPLPDGRSALETIVTTAYSMTDHVYLSVESLAHAERLAEAGSTRARLLLDDQPGSGPLAALAGALDALPELSGVLLLAVDAPLAPPSILAHLARTLLDGQGEAGHTREPVADRRGVAPPDVVAPMINGFAQPLPACYAVRLAPVARRLLGEGRRSLRSLLEEPGVVVAALQAPALGDERDLSYLVGANTPAEWSALRRRAGGA